MVLPKSQRNLYLLCRRAAERARADGGGIRDAYGDKYWTVEKTIGKVRASHSRSWNVQSCCCKLLIICIQHLFSFSSDITMPSMQSARHSFGLRTNKYLVFNLKKQYNSPPLQAILFLLWFSLFLVYCEWGGEHGWSFPHSAGRATRGLFAAFEGGTVVLMVTTALLAVPCLMLLLPGWTGLHQEEDEDGGGKCRRWMR